jgi:hypothetical protein
MVYVTLGSFLRVNVILMVIGSPEDLFLLAVISISNGDVSDVKLENPIFYI